MLLTSVITVIVIAQPASQMTYQDDAKKLLLLLGPQGGVPGYQVHAVQGHEAFAVPGGNDWRDSCAVKDPARCIARILLACQEHFCDQVCFRSLRSFPNFGSPQFC